MFQRIVYRAEVPHLDPVDILEKEPAEDSGALYEASVLTKDLCWSHEREWRAMHKEANKLFGYGYQALTGIYFGAAMSAAHREIVCLMLRDRPTKLHMMERADRRFGLVAREVNYTPYPFKAAG